MLKVFTSSFKIVLFLLYVSANVSFAQDTILPFSNTKGKKIVNHTTYDSWKSITSQVLSNDGKWLAYEISPQVGDGKLYLYNTETAQLDSFDRGKTPTFLYAGSGYLVFKIAAPYKLTRKAKLDKKKPDDMPKDSLALFDLINKKIFKLGNVKSFAANDFSTYVLAHLGKEKKPAPPVLSKREKKKRAKNPPIEVKSEGTTLVVWDPITGLQQRFANVTEYSLSAKSSTSAFVVQEKGKNDSSYVKVVQPLKEPVKGKTPLFEHYFSVVKAHQINGWTKTLALDDKGEQLAFLTSKDTCKNNKMYALFYKNNNASWAEPLVDTSNKIISKGLTVSENGKIYFSPKGNHLFFGIAKTPKQDPKDTLTEDEKFVVDIWHWNDERIQPEQLKQLDKDKKNSFLTVYNTDSKALLQIENDSLKVDQMMQRGDGNKVLLSNDRPYRKTQTWQTQLPVDYYILDMFSKESKLLLKAKTHPVSLSYNGTFALWYDPVKHDWFSVNTTTGENLLVTNSIDDNLAEDNNGLAELPYPYGVMGWSKNDEYVYVYSEYEIWKVQPENKEKVTCLTKNKGGEFDTDLRYIKLDKEIDYIDESRLLLKSFNHHSKREGFWEYMNGVVKPLMVDDYRISFLGKAKNTDKLMYTKMDFQTFPDLLLNDFTFKNERQITKANPQQKEYAWGTVELVKWKTFEGHNLEGLLYKPDNFDESKKYPMIVYYYEKNSDNLHQYRSPRPSASTVNFTEYVSNGYVIFVPDIVYRLGDPGKSAYDCIVSGTKSMLEKGFIDEQNIALQGQSWGGYQTAYLVTQTNMFKAAFAGAPVGNMTSAYGGVRWESGLLRAFQYEKGQSRIGKTLWEDREAYIRNSPVFFLDKVNTPLLLMNNDNDGAVPWYQGIEIYTGLRRMEKPCWLLNYNGDGHNLTKRPNQVDLSRRMLQFFNHYLKGEPMPQWMKDGLPAVQKGKVTGY